MATILPRDLIPAGSVPNSAAIIVDNGTTVQRATPTQVAAMIADPDAIIGYSGARVTVAAGDTVEAGSFRYQAAASDALDEHVITAGGVKLYVQPVSGLYNVAAFGALPGTAIDNSPIIQKAINAGPALIPDGAWPGAWRVDDMIVLEVSQSLTLGTGVRLQRLSEHSASTDPVVWVRGSNARLEGAGKRFTSVNSGNRSPKGVVRVGHEDMTVSHATVTFCTVRGLEIIGAQVNGQTSGDPDICLFIPNAQLGGLNANYFHTLNDLLLTQANFGINLRGWANGNNISDIHGRQLGNATWGDGGLLWIQGALDNAINLISFHQAANQTAVIIDDYDNTGVPGGVLHVPQMNYIGGVVAEQGGANALGIKAYSGIGNVVEIISNVGGGNQLHSTWNASRNILVGGVANLTGHSTGAGWVKTITGIGTVQARIQLNQTLSGTATRTGVAIVRYHGANNDGTALRSAEYHVPLTGVSTYAMGAPVKNWGDDLTITQISNSASHVTIGIAGASADARATVTVEVQAYPGATVD